jgi:ABC-type multidrug transport system fused ATPase/permease subunit
VSLVTFACYSYLLHRPLTSARVFSSLSLFNILIRPLNAFPWVINGLVEGRVSVRRVYAFLVSEERVEEEVQARRPRKVEEFTLQQQLSAQQHPNATSSVSTPASVFGGTHDEHECALCVQGSFDFIPALEDEKEKNKPKAQLLPTDHDEAAKENKQLKQPKQSSPPLEMQVKSPSPSPPVHALHAVSLHIRRGESVLLHGRVGAGKSTLLLALLGELVPVGDPLTESFRCVNLDQTLAEGDGPSTASGAMAFVGQQDVWLPNATVREVILCFAPFDASLYERVLFACALGPDLASWPAGDRTEVGEAGVNVSGGQRVRLALARACYAAAAGTVQVVLLDDPLAAVDAHVAAHLVRHVLSDDEGLLGARNSTRNGRGGITRVLVTHQVGLLRPHVHRLLEMSGGRIVREEDGGLRLRLQSGGAVVAGEGEGDVERGNAEEHKSSAVGVASSSLSPQPRPSSLPLSSDAALSSSSPAIGGDTPSSPSANGSGPADSASGPINGDGDDPIASPAVADAVADDAASLAAAAAAELAAERALLEKGFLTVEESRVRGSIRSKVLRVYLLDFVGGPLCALILLSMVLMQASRNGSDWWLSYWVQQTTSAERDHDGGGSDGELSEGRAHYYLRIYAYLAGANSLAALFRSFIFAYGGLVAAEALFRRLLRRVLAAPVSFFDSQPQGRLTNRFSSDIYSVDENIPFQANILLAVLFSLMGSLVVIAMVVPVVLVLLPVLGIAYARMQRLYRSVSREVRRLDSVSRSPLYARFVEAIAGAVSIRAMQLSKPLRARTRATLDRNQKIQFVGLGLSQWLNIRLQLVGVSMITLVSILAVLSCVYPELDRSKYTSWLLNPSLVGLAIAYALPLTDNLNGLISTATDTEKEVVSVERTIEYMEVRGEEEGDGAEENESQAEEQQQNGVHLQSSDDDGHEYDEDLEVGRSGRRSLKLTSSPKVKTKQKHASINEVSCNSSIAWLYCSPLISPRSGTI